MVPVISGSLFTGVCRGYFLWPQSIWCFPSGSPPPSTFPPFSVYTLGLFPLWQLYPSLYIGMHLQMCSTVWYIVVYSVRLTYQWTWGTCTGFSCMGLSSTATHNWIKGHLPLATSSCVGVMCHALGFMIMWYSMCIHDTTFAMYSTYTVAIGVHQGVRVLHIILTRGMWSLWSWH